MQEILVFAIVGASAFYLCKMLWNASAGKKSGCNGCGSSCASQKKNEAGSTPSASVPLLQIDLDGTKKK